MLTRMLNQLGVLRLSRSGAAVLALTAFVARAEGITSKPVADASVFEPSPTNGLGAVAALPAGTVNGAARSRLLLRFDVSTAIPAGAVVTGVSRPLALNSFPPTPAPRIDRIELVGDDVRLLFAIEGGKLYAVEFNEAIGSTNWATLSYAASKFWPTNWVATDSRLNAPRRFYRLAVLGDID